MWVNFKELKNFLPQKIVTKLSKIWVWEPGSGKNLFRIPDPGVKRHRIPDPQHWYHVFIAVTQLKKKVLIV